MSHDRNPFENSPGELEGEATQISAPSPYTDVRPPAPRPPAPRPPAPRPPAPHPTPSVRPPAPHPSTPLVPSRSAPPPPSSSPHKVVPQVLPSKLPSFAPPPATASAPPLSSPPSAAPSAPPGPRPNPFQPAGVVQRAAPSKRDFGKGFTGTIMGTMVFIAQSKSVGRGAILGGVLLVLAGIAAGAVLYVQKQNRDEARAALDAAIAEPDGAGVERVRALTADGLDDEALPRALAFLGTHRDGASVPSFIEALEGTPEVQRAAVDGLAAIGAPDARSAADALERQLESEDETIRLHAAWALTRIEDARGLDVLVTALAAGHVPTLDSYEPRTLASVMGRDGLRDRLTHESGTVRQFAARHLGDVCQGDDQAPLARAASDTDVAVSNSAIVSLSRCGMADAARSAIASIFESGSARWDALYVQMRGDAGAPALGLLLPHAPDEAARRAVTAELANSFDPRAARALLAELERLEAPDSQDRLAVGRALAFASHVRLVEVLEPLLSGDEPDHRNAAIALLGQSGGADGVEPRLVSMLRSADSRGAALDALGTLGACEESTRSAMARYLSAPAFRRSAMRALGRCGHERAVEMARREVAEPIDAPVTVQSGAFRIAALEVVAHRRLEDLAAPLFEQASDPQTDPRIRLAIADTLAIIAPDAMRDQAFDRLTDTQQPRPVRAAMRRLLRSRVPASTVPRLMGYVRGGEDDARTLDAAILVGLAHHGPTREERVTLLGDERGQRHAALALALGTDRDSAPALARLIRRDDTLSSQLAEDLQTPPWVFHRLSLDGLGAHVGSAMAMRDAGWSLPAARLCDALTSPPEEGALGATQADLARHFFERLTGEGHDDPTRAIAAEALACMGARSAVLSVRDARSTGSAAARRALGFTR